MIEVTITLAGRSSLICHNVQMADPDCVFVKRIAELTSKTAKTEADRREIERQKWYGGLYIIPDQFGPVLPTANVRKCLWNAAKAIRQGTSVTRALTPKDAFVPIVYDGPRDIDELFKDAAYTSRLPVGIKTNKIFTVRPQFPRWAVVVDAWLNETMLDYSLFESIVEMAGQVEGLGDNRINGYGRFDGKVVRK